VRDLLAALGQPPDEIVARLAPGERNAFAAYLATVPAPVAAGAVMELRDLDRQLAGATVTGAERIADGVARVRLGGGLGPHAEVIAVRRDGTWYPSMVFTFTDVTLTTAEREHS
ncbi:MAG TPA: hypothetical protein VFA45_07995, partial [Actinomycetes bacterium]|nr:hypothetical protein [Actinomycetes bacterium]